MSFNENSTQPEHAIGHNEMERAPDSADETNPEPSVAPSSRFLPENQQWLLKQFDIEVRDDGLPHFIPNESLLNQLVARAPNDLANARGIIDREGNEKQIAKREELQAGAKAFYDTVEEHYGEISVWISRTTVIWPVDNQVGRNLFKFTMAELQLRDAVKRAIRFKRIKNASPAEVAKDEECSNKNYWAQLYGNELGIWDAVSQGAEPHDYDLAKMLRAGYNSECQAMTRKYLRNGNEFNPETLEDYDDPSNEADLDAQLAALR